MKCLIVLVICAAAIQAAEATDTYVPSFDGTFVAAAMRKPEGNGPFPALLFIHGGVGGNGFDAARRMVTDPVPERFLKLGYVVMATDYRRFHFGEDELQDVMASYRKLSGYPFVDGKRVGVIGGSHGGYLAEFLATRIRPAAVVSYGGGTDIVSYFYPQAQKMRGEIKSYSQWVEELTSGRRAVREIPFELAYKFGDRREMYEAISPHTHAARVQCPLLFIAAGKDNEISRVSARQLVDSLAARGVPARYEEFPGMPHGFSWGRGAKPPAAFGESLRITTEFVEKYVRGSR
jgi:dipeptidyl aminopeptidase/acylaminoacyl peptidase